MSFLKKLVTGDKEKPKDAPANFSASGGKDKLLKELRAGAPALTVAFMEVRLALHL